MEGMSEFDQYRSPYSWRYASVEMRRLWSEVEKRLLWRKIWLALAEVQAEFGLINADKLEDLRSHVQDVDIQRALEIEAEIHHDLMAELKTFAGQCPLGGGALHLGATSADIEDNADALRLKAALGLILDALEELLLAFSARIEENAGLPELGFTHLQPAEPTTIGYRLAIYAQDLLEDYRALRAAQRSIRGKGFKGAVGTGAAYAELIGAENLDDFETRLSRKLGLEFFPVTSQTYPRKQEYSLLCALAGLGASLYKFAFDLRLLQSPPIGEWSEPFAAGQVGSSAMPFKRNPIGAEKIDSLARALSAMPQVAWANAAHSLLERTLDDSANRRALLPEAFLIADELLIAARRILRGLQIDRAAVQRNLQAYAPFASTERILMALVQAGADRQEMHEILRRHALAAWQAVQAGQANPLIEAIKSDQIIRGYLPAEQIDQLGQVESYLGLAENRALALAKAVREEIEQK
jgi:adenylosuccinate lyase